jgi:hypothetical protein
MSVIDTKGVFQDATHLRLDEPVAVVCNKRVRVLLVFDDALGDAAPLPDFRAAIGSYQRDFPHAPVRSATEWLKEFREGE